MTKQEEDGGSRDSEAISGFEQCKAYHLTNENASDPSESNNYLYTIRDTLDMISEGRFTHETDSSELAHAQ